MKFSQFLSILRARWMILAGVLAVLVSIALTAGFALPKKYTATGSVLIDSRSPDPINGTMAVTTGNYLSTQMDIIRSERVGLKVVRALRMTENGDLRARWRESTNGEGIFENWIVALLADGLEVKPTRDSNVINVSYTGADPAFASTLANAFINNYIETSLELRVEPARQFGTMFQTQLKQAREKLDESQRKLSAYQQDKGIVATDERLDVETARLGELSAQVVGLQAQTADAESRRARAGINSPDSMGNGVIMALKGDLARQEARLQEASSRLGEGHPQITELRAGIAELKARIQAESGNVGLSSNVGLQISQQREAQARAALEAQRSKVLKLKAIRDEAQLMVKDVESAQRAFDSIQARISQTSLEGQSNQTNVSILKVATPPTGHSSPRPLLYTLQAIFVGLFLGIGLVLMIELKHRRIRGDQDLADLVNADLIGHMPSAKPKASRALPIQFAPKLPSTAMLRLPATGK
ncbi:chain length determinant protein EpsF [Aquabacterium sp.]|uniref:chain length determinant protein EpsF n=1 Tax=Aquabacterium sp. TaxID=1872578 RepID=UPI003D6CAD81